MEASSKLNIRQSAKKVRLVLNEVKNSNVNVALSKLSFINKKAAKHIYKTISSALANFQQAEPSADMDSLYITKAFINQGPTMKRFRPAAMGRSVRILKRTSHLNITISDKKDIRS